MYVRFGTEETANILANLSVLVAVNQGREGL